MISFFKQIFLSLKAQRIVRTEEDVIDFGTTPLRASIAASVLLQGTNPYENCGPTQDLISKALVVHKIPHYRVNWYPEGASRRNFGSDIFTIDNITKGHGNIVGTLEKSKGFFKKRWWMAGSLYTYSEISNLNRMIDTVCCLADTDLVLGRAWKVNLDTGKFKMVDLRIIEKRMS